MRNGPAVTSCSTRDCPNSAIDKNCCEVSSAENRARRNAIALIISLLGFQAGDVCTIQGFSKEPGQPMRSAQL